MTGCRIGKVTLKNGTQIVPFPAPARDARQKDIVRHARKLADAFDTNEMTGFITIAWNADSAYSLGYGVTPGEGPGMSLIPTWVADCIRREFISNGDWE
jgi:hypothetical protein